MPRAGRPRVRKVLQARITPLDCRKPRWVIHKTLFRACNNQRPGEAITNAPAALYAEVRTRLSGTYGEMSVVLSQMGEPAQAIVASRRGLEVMNELSAAHPDNRLYQSMRTSIVT